MFCSALSSLHFSFRLWCARVLAVALSGISAAHTGLTVMNVFRYTAIRQNQLLHIRLSDINLEERWIDLNIEGAKNHREHRVPIVSSLYSSLEELVRKAGEAGMKLGDQIFNVGWFDLVRKSIHYERSSGVYHGSVSLRSPHTGSAIRWQHT